MQHARFVATVGPASDCTPNAMRMRIVAVASTNRSKEYRILLYLKEILQLLSEVLGLWAALAARINGFQRAPADHCCS